MQDSGKEPHTGLPFWSSRCDGQYRPDCVICTDCSSALPVRALLAARQSYGTDPGMVPPEKTPSSSSIRKATIFHVSFSLESQN